ncbi:VPA1267 family protein [Paraburkholderia sp. HP33-1]|uniref:VPA1267 family protein n=1 Tax=Paraburkholderia sp. HP33-1 TaxID=2883243 RepID=UPI001EEF0922|nr:VPA1267 family protein [Paraburkholderia sp. HP33-1]
MPSGQQLSEQNLTTFTVWLASKTDAEFRAMVSRGVLSRKEIAKECGFAQSALNQNPRIKAALKAKEDELRESGILPALADEGSAGAAGLPMRKPDTSRAAVSAEHVRRLESDLAAARAELSEVKRKLERYELLDEALATTGRLLR